MPNIASSFYTTIPLIIISHFNTFQNILSGCYLVRTHHHQLVINSEHTEVCQYTQYGMFGKEGLSKVVQHHNALIAGIRPPRGKLKRVAHYLTFLCPFIFLIEMQVASRIAVILCKGTIADNINLHIFKQSIVCPKRLSVIALYLVESLTNIHAWLFELHMHHWQTIH